MAGRLSFARRYALRQRRRVGSRRKRPLAFEPLEDRNLFAVLPAGFTETVVAQNLTSPITMDIEESGRIWLAYQDGRIEVIENDALLPTPVIQLDADGSGERGLQGIELDPHFHDNGYIYVYYTAAHNQAGQLASHNRLSRLTVDPTTENTIVPGSEVILLELPEFSTLPINQSPIWHMGGAIHFLADETIAVQVGDHLNNVIVQNNNTPLGKVLRVNKDGSPATDNPFYNVADTNPPGGSDWNGNAPGETDWIDYVWASGLRNPFSGDVDPATGRYFIADVGQSAWEEINDATNPGRNFGWPTTEGSFNPATYPNFTNPFYAYSHAGGQCAITGGAFYSPALAAFPPEYLGKFFFSEFCGGTIWVIDPNNPADVEIFASNIEFPMNIELAADGSMYFIERGAGAGGNPGIGTGKIVKVQYAAQIAPQIVLQPTNTLASVGYDATFTVSAAGTPPLAYQWQRHNGTDFVNIAGAAGSSLVLPDVSIADDGAQFRVAVSNDYGSATSNAVVLDVTTDTPPTPVIDPPALAATYRAGDTIQFSGHATDLEDVLLPGAALTWQVDFHHATHLHPFMPPTSGVTNGEFTIPASSETAHDVWYRVRLIATDSARLTTEVYRDILPEKSDFLVTNNMAGGTVFVDGQTKQAPHAVTGVVNVQRSLEAPQQQTVGSLNGTFIQWLDGVMEPQRAIATPEVDTAYVAIYGTLPLQGAVYVSDLMPIQATNGWGPIELDTSNGEQPAGDGNPITLNGVVYSKGLGVHADSDVRYNLSGAYRRFISDIGLDDEKSAGNVIFRVYGDNVLLYDSGAMTATTATKTIDIDVTGVQELRLFVDKNVSTNSDHADWADARLVPITPGEILINFQEDMAPVPTGYLKDAGHVFGNRGNGHSYGWSSDHTDLDRDRNVNSDQRLDTLLHFHAGQDWEIAIPNGSYQVTASIGDAGNPGTHTLNVEGVAYWTNQALASNQFRQLTQSVIVSDGRLTLDQGSAVDKATRINFVEIVPVASGVELFPLASADVTLNGKVSYADVLAFGAGWGGHAGGLSLEQLVRLGDLNFDGSTDQADWDLFNAAWIAAGMPALSQAAVLNPITGDYNRDGIIDGGDQGLWRSSFGSMDELATDGNGDGTVDAADYVVWRRAMATGAGAGGGGVVTTPAAAVDEPVVEAALTAVAEQPAANETEEALVTFASDSVRETRFPRQWARLPLHPVASSGDRLDTLLLVANQRSNATVAAEPYTRVNSLDSVFESLGRAVGEEGITKEFQQFKRPMLGRHALKVLSRI
ncbi:MAG: NPCBM/NEW2 domain-containing protein [Pirellulales bacterium]